MSALLLVFTPLPGVLTPPAGPLPQAEGEMGSSLAFVLREAAGVAAIAAAPRTPDMIRHATASRPAA
jgi:hypothetical protein